MIKDKELSVNLANKAKTMRKNTNEKLRKLANIYLIKHNEIMIHLKQIKENGSIIRIWYGW